MAPANISQDNITRPAPARHGPSYHWRGARSSGRLAATALGTSAATMRTRQAGPAAPAARGGTGRGCYNRPHACPEGAMLRLFPLPAGERPAEAVYADLNWPAPSAARP